ncbi:MAG: tryptophan synthase subunit alpha, partial [Gemmataceae bacterium]|nr:tryptophan synthase subunit alpha [Gemmataceae bacterium]
MPRIAETFARLEAEGRRAFMPFLTAGDPDAASTLACARALVRAGASLIELGFPYSDPIADGPVIQASYTRALERGLKIAEVFDIARAVREVPVVGMASYSLVWRRGADAFLAQAREAGMAGLIVPDLPVEESASLRGACAGAGLDLVQLVTPTTPRERAERIVAQSMGFVYVVSVAGITGERASLPDELAGQLAWLRTKTDLPLCVGFGVSRPEQVRMLRGHA